jgi:hypothetical protein
MIDRNSQILGTQAAAAFPALARFLAENTTLTPDVAELALRAAVKDYGAASDAVVTKVSWKRAVDLVNMSGGATNETIATAKRIDPWGAAVAAANGQVGAA